LEAVIGLSLFAPKFFQTYEGLMREDRVFDKRDSTLGAC
jgi:hypothetical protein